MQRDWKAELRAASGPRQALLQAGAGQEDKLSLIVFSGSLDRLIAAFVLATGAAAMGMQVSGLSYCGVAKFLETAAPGKITMFV